MDPHRFNLDAIERISWTALELVSGLLVTEVTPLDTWWALPIGTGLALLKALAAKHIGQKGTASTLPASADPAGQGPTAPPPPHVFP